MANDRTLATPATDEIARLAYERYEARGREDGFDLEDWLAAEQEARLRQSGIADGTAAASAVHAAEPLGGARVEQANEPQVAA
jgi:hypothetical protein